MTDKTHTPPDPPSWWDISESGNITVAPREHQEVADRLADRVDRAFEDRFPFIEPLAEGGMGKVYIGRDRDLRRLVAVKVMRPKVRQSRRAASRFFREAQVTAQLSHPSVVPLHTLDATSEGNPALVMKWIEGLTFDDYVDRCWEATDEGAIQKEEYGRAVRLEHFLRVCDAVAYAHSRGVLHCDLKPANLMVGAYGETYVMDWGLARILGTGEEDPEGPVDADPLDGPADGTRMGSVAGTPGYMSPEQAIGKSTSLTPASDQYSLGLVLYHLLTFRRPRYGGDLNTVLELAKKGEMRSFGQTAGEPLVPPELRAIVARATAFEPDDRYLSVTALANDLRRFLRREEIEAYPDDLARKLWRKVEKHPVATLSSILLVVALAATISIIGLYGRYTAERRGAERAQTIASLVSEVSEHALEVDRLLFRIENLVAGLAVGIGEGLIFGSDLDSTFPQPDDLLGSTPIVDTVTLDRYGGQNVSFEMPVQVRAHQADPVILDDLAHRLAGQTRLFARLFHRSAGGALDNLSPDRLRDALREGRAPVHYLYAGLEPGLLLSYPATSVFPEGYDPRQRPWYRESKKRQGIHWGRPYPDASGSGWLVPCNLALRDSEGELIGVVGADLTLERVLHALEATEIEAPRATLFVDSELRLLADSRRGEPKLGVGLHGQESLQTRPLRSSELTTRLRAGDHSGFVLVGDSLFLFARVEALSWYLIVEMDRQIAFAGAAYASR